MKIKIESNKTTTKKPNNRLSKMLQSANEINGLSTYQKHLLINFTYFMVGQSKISAPAFKALLTDFMGLVPDNQKTRQLEYCVENKTRNLVPSWFREPTSGVTATDNMKGRHKKADESNLDHDESF